jgi:hypothetical protein
MVSKRARVDDEAMSRSLSADFAARLEESTADAESPPQRVSVYLSERIVKNAKRHAKARSLSFSVLVKLALEEYLQNHGGTR